MQMVTFLPLTESVSISLLCRYTVVANVFTIVSSLQPHYQWLTGRQRVSDDAFKCSRLGGFGDMFSKQQCPIL